MLKNRPPYDTEVDVEVAKEFQRIQEEKRTSRPDHGRDIEEVRTRITDLEGNVARLGENVSASHKRLEEMLRQLLQNRGTKETTAAEDVIEPSSSTKVVETSGLTSTTTEAWTVVQKDFLLPMLHPVPVGNVAQPVLNTGDIDVAEGVNRNEGEEEDVAAVDVDDDGAPECDEDNAVDDVHVEEEEGDKPMEDAYAIVGIDGEGTTIGSPADATTSTFVQQVSELGIWYSGTYLHLE